MWVCCVVFLRAELRGFECCLVHHGKRDVGVLSVSRNRNMIRHACDITHVEHDVCMEEEKGARGIKGAGKRRGARGVKGAGYAAGCAGCVRI